MWFSKIRKHGKSVAVGIPAQVRRDLDIHIGDYLLLTTENATTIHAVRVRRQDLIDITPSSSWTTNNKK